MKKSKILLWVSTGLLVLLVGFFALRRSTGKATRVEEKPGYRTIEETDPAMKAAISGARRTVSRFIDKISHPKPSYTYFAIKSAFRENRNVEHLWISFVRYDGKMFIGNIASTPHEIRSLVFGTEVHVSPDSISDWMVVDNGVLEGGYTLRLLRARMTPPERRQFDQDGGFTSIDTTL